MAGASGCIPDYHVNFFGQLCKPARSFAVTDPYSEPQTNTNSQADSTPAPQHITIPVSEPDPIAEAFREHQHLVRGFSGGNVETYLATVKEVFAEVRRDRRSVCVEQGREQQLAGHKKVDSCDERQAEDQNECQDQEQYQEQQPAQHEDQHGLQNSRRSQHRSQSLPEEPAHPSSPLITSQDKDEVNVPNVPRQGRSQRDEDAMYCVEGFAEDREKDCDELCLRSSKAIWIRHGAVYEY